MEDKHKKIKKLTIILSIVVVVLILSYGGLIIYLTWPISSYSVDKAGVYGDSFGLLTSLFSGLAFIGLIATILLQREDLKLQTEELRLTREEMKRQNEAIKHQNFESTFFQMLRLHNDILNSIDLRSLKHGEATTDSGRDCFVTFRSRLRKKYLSEDTKTFAKEKGYSLLYAAYELFWTEHQHELGHYFRYLYNIFKFIKNSNIENKRLYTNLIRAQLSDQELTLLFYNCLYKYGEEKFKPLIEEFAVFNNLPCEMLIEQKHRDLFAESAYGEDDSP